MSSMVALSKIQIPSNIRTIEGVEDLHGTPLNEFPLDEKATILSLANNIQRYGLLPISLKNFERNTFEYGLRTHVLVKVEGRAVFWSAS